MDMCRCSLDGSKMDFGPADVRVSSAARYDGMTRDMYGTEIPRLIRI